MTFRKRDFVEERGSDGGRVERIKTLLLDKTSITATNRKTTAASRVLKILKVVK